MEEISKLDSIFIELDEEPEKKKAETKIEKGKNIEVKTGTGNNRENQLLAIISNKEYICYAVEVKYKDYLMFTDNEITYDLIKLNPKINVIEDNQQKEIDLICKKLGFFQKSIDNITITLVRYSGLFNSNKIIKYDPYSNRSKDVNPLIIDYRLHLKSLEEDISKEDELEEKRIARRKQLLEYFYIFLCILICTIIIALGIIYPSFGMLLLEILAEGIGQAASG